MRLVTDTLWNGAEARRGEAATVHLRDEGGHLRVRIDAPWHRDPPPTKPPGPTDRLWEHEVVEVFVAGPGQPVPYAELEIGPYGHYLLLRLEGVRGVAQTLLPAEVSVTRDARGWRADARVDKAHLPPRPWRVNACAIHGQGPERRYLSHAYLGAEAQPDFHQPAAFLPYAEARGF